jgi:MoxR-like ATPase
VISSVEELEEALAHERYITDTDVAVPIFLALRLQRPLFLEGEPGVGKTETAKVLARVLGSELIRLQCYEGLDVSHAVYEWNYPRQLLEIRMLDASHEVDRQTLAAQLYSEPFLIRRPLLRALEVSEGPAPVLLIDEIDRADEEFEGYLLELLAEYQVTIPELGVVRAEIPPVVIITSNRTREVHDALKRRCIYAWLDYPDFDKEYRIVMSKVPGISARLASQVTAFVQDLRSVELYKAAGVSETLDWAAALVALDCDLLDASVVDHTLGVLLKHGDDITAVKGELTRTLVARALARA